MSFQYVAAQRRNAPILIGLAGGTGSGKTESAMRIATGFAGDKKFAVLDTEAGRALHKADDYLFDHCDLSAPFTPERYTEAIKAADDANYPVIVIDSVSHIWEGVGGILEMQEEDLQRRINGDESRRKAMTPSSWIEPKKRHRRFVNQLTQLRSHLVLCFRAQDKIEIVKQDGRTVIRPMESLIGADGWVPICERRLPFELTLSLLLLAESPGVPKPIKLEARHRPFVPLDRPLDESVGRALAAWAAGGKSSAGGPKAAGADGVPGAVSRAGSPSEPASPADVPMATEAQRRKLFAAARARGVDDQRLREILGEVNAGNESTRELPRALVDAVLAVIEAEPVPA
jgi:hypothetical protein